MKKKTKTKTTAYPPAAKGKTRVTLAIPHDVLKDVRHLAVDRDEDLQDTVTAALVAFLAAQNGR